MYLLNYYIIKCASRKVLKVNDQYINGRKQFKEEANYQLQLLWEPFFMPSFFFNLYYSIATFFCGQGR